jgi:nucleotide-binding universal stress UspA family protein
MHVLIAIDGSRQSLTAANYLRRLADPEEVTDVSIVAVIRPLASVAFADEISGRPPRAWATADFREQAEAALDKVAEKFDGWGPKVHKRLRSGSPANEIIKAAKQLKAELIVVASGGRGLSDTVLMGSTAQRVQQYAPCPVLVVRPVPRPRPARKSARARR